jgi:hypothetical protein
VCKVTEVKMLLNGWRVVDKVVGEELCWCTFESLGRGAK